MDQEKLQALTVRLALINAALERLQDETDKLLVSVTQLNKLLEPDVQNNALAADYADSAE